MSKKRIVLVSLVIRGRYVPSYLTANLDKIPYLTGKLSFWTIFLTREFADKISANNEDRLYTYVIGLHLEALKVVKVCKSLLKRE